MNVTTVNETKIIAEECARGIINSPENISFAIFMSLIMFLSVVGNALVIVGIFISRELRNRPSVYLIMSLAFSDILMAISSIPFKISERFYMGKNPFFCHSLPACYCMVLTDVIANVSSILMLLLISLDRFIAIRFPFKYNELFNTFPRIKTMIAVVWISSAVWSMIGIIPWKEEYASEPDGKFSVTIKVLCINGNLSFYMVTACVYMVVFSLMTIINAMVLRIAVIQIHAIALTQIIPQNDYELSEQTSIKAKDTKSPEIRAKKQRDKLVRKRELHATKSVLIVYLAFVICWMPSCLMNIILMFDVDFLAKVQDKRLMDFIWHGLSQIFPMITTMINPFIYAFSNRPFRKAFTMISNRILNKRYFEHREHYQSTTTYIQG